MTTDVTRDLESTSSMHTAPGDTVKRRVLIAFGSKRGGTAEIAEAIAAALRERGLAVDCARASAVRDVARYDAVIVGGALYMFRWVREARRFVRIHTDELRARPVWMFSSGPLDASAGTTELPPVRGVAALMARVGARGHATFGGRLRSDATGFPAAAMAKKQAGDWRDWDRIRAWAHKTADTIEVTPRPAAAAPVRPARWTPGALGLLIGGGALLAWLAGEVAVLHSVHVLQLGYLAIAVVMLAVALHRRARPLAARLH
jgi:menaquinone-dependent protoporphyrinogen oxidase